LRRPSKAEIESIELVPEILWVFCSLLFTSGLLSDYGTMQGIDFETNYANESYAGLAYHVLFFHIGLDSN